MKIFNLLKPKSTKFFKRQEDLLLHLEKLRIIYSGQTVLIPSLICSEVIYALQKININLVFYQLDKNFNFDFSEILRIIQEDKIDFLYIYRSFNNYKSISKIKSVFRKEEISLIIDNAHFLKIDGNYPKFGCKINKNNYLLETFSPRKYFRLREGAMLRINNQYAYINTEFNISLFLIDKFKRSVLIRRLINTSINKIKLNFLIRIFKKNNSKIKQLSCSKIKGVSIIYHNYFKNYENTYHSKSMKFYNEYLNLFKDNLARKNREINKNLIFWLLPIKKDSKINRLVDFFQDSSLNPFMEWPDKHKFLSNEDLRIRDEFIFFRIDSLSCNAFAYKYISKIYDSFNN